MRGRKLVAVSIVLVGLIPASASLPVAIQSPPLVEAGGVPAAQIVPHVACGVPEAIPPDWVTVRIEPAADILRTIARIPHDPNPLGVRQALGLTTRYPISSTFFPITFASADDTPLAGMLGQWFGDSRPRPGVVLVNGLAQSKDLKMLVEIAELFYRNGWHVLTFDPRGHGDSRRLSPAMTTLGWKETEDVLAAVRTLREKSQATSVAVIGFSTHGRSLVRAMAQDQGQLIGAGIAVSAPLGAYRRQQPPPPGWTPTLIQKYLLDFLGAPSLYDHLDRTARSYGIDRTTLEEQLNIDGVIARVARPLLLLDAPDDAFMLTHVKEGRHDAGMFNLGYGEILPEHPHVRTLLVDRGDHSGQLYLSDPHWFALATLTYLKHWQARDDPHVTALVPPLDILAEGVLEGHLVRYRLVVRNHGLRAVGPVDVHLQLPSEGRLESCWVGFEGLGRCTTEGRRVSWTMPRLSGGKTTAGPFLVTVDVGRLEPGAFEAEAWITTAEGLRESLEVGNSAATPQQVRLTKQ
jgi:predicted alpha/beta-fold hydrolase